MRNENKAWVGYPRRPDFHNTYHHVVVRGVNGLPIFDSSLKREQFLSLIQETRHTHDVRIYAFGFLDNHWHGFLRRVEHPMSRFFQTVKSRYTVWYNNQFRRTGTLYDGRYFSSIVEADAYFLTVWRYVQNQGVAAGCFEKPTEDPGSTAALYAGINERYQWIDWEEAIEHLDIPEEGLGGELKDEIEDGRSPENLPDLPVRRVRDQQFIAGDDYIEKYMQIRRETVRDEPRGETPIGWDQLLNGVEEMFDRDRDEILSPTKQREIHRIRAGLAFAARKYGHCSNVDIAEKMGVSGATVSRTIEKTRKDENLKDRWEKWMETVNRSV